ncbi:MAG TPA: class I SAM-dependent methyltransferase [Ktedonobacteraceae bacterium]|nr:class I SAM-dependent methyltransferase [Ktedonobacteraceae bacterium]
MNEAMPSELRIGRYGRLQAKLFQDMLRELGVEMHPDSLMLDFGCGEGGIVYQLRKQGLKAFGVDIVNDYAWVQQRCLDEGLAQEGEDTFRLIDVENYRIPFDDNTFDVIFSDQVFEHVQNYPQALSEIKRVLKPGGSSLHIIPSRYRPVEGHLFIPLGGIFQGRRYLAFWARLGIRNSFQQGQRRQEVADFNYDYLKHSTTYYTKSKIKRLFTAAFGNVTFVEPVFIHCHFGRVRRYLYPITRRFPAMAALFCTLHSRVVFSTKAVAEWPANAAVRREQ